MSKELDLNKMTEFLNNDTKEEKEKRKLIALEVGIKRQLDKLEKEKKLFSIEDEIEETITIGSMTLPQDTEISELKNLYAQLDVVNQVRQDNEFYIVCLDKKLFFIEEFSFFKRLCFLILGKKYLLKNYPRG